MSLTNRDDFPEKTKRIVALRAGYRCSFSGCRQLTSGPSEESETAVTSIGEAAHISAASPGGKRYLASISAEGRSSIENAIWLCVNHARLIDRDSETYSIAVLQKMKQDHEAWCASEIRSRSISSPADLFAIGPDVVCLGEMTRVVEAEWDFQINHFIVGDLAKLVAFIDGFWQSPPYDRYVLDNSVGDGRVLAGSPSLTKNQERYIASCPVQHKFPRIDAASLEADLALSASNDLIIEKGDLRLVSGLAALPQKIRMGLSIQKGELLFDRDLGARLAEYYNLLRGSPWLEHLFKLEVIRQAAIPYTDTLSGMPHTPLQCVERVWGVEVLVEDPKNQSLPIRVDLEVKGVGRWQHEMFIDLPQNL